MLTTTEAAQMIEDCENRESALEQPGVYMVSVDGAGAPAVEHPSLASAMREAERLSKSGVKNKIRVLRVERVYVRTVEWKWHVPAPVYDAEALP